MTQKRIYQKPVIQVFELKQQLRLLAGSTGNGQLDPMGDPQDMAPEFNFEEEIFSL